MSKQKQKESLSVIIAKTALVIAIITGLGTIIFGGGVVIMKYYNSEVSNGIVNFVDQEVENCAKEGESVGTCAGCMEKCCQGLKPMANLKYNGECVNLPAPGSGGVCSNCGNGICDDENSEDECNCPEDCGEKINENFYCKENSDCKVYFSHCDCKYHCVNKDIKMKDCDKFCYAIPTVIPECVCEANKCVDKKLSISDWQTYRNEEFGFEMKYPEKYKIYDYAGKTINRSPTVKKYNNPIANFTKEEQHDITAYIEYWETREGHLSFHGSEPDFIIEANKSGYIVIDYSPDINYPVSSELKKEWETILSTFKFIEKEEKLNWLSSDFPYFSSLVSFNNQKVVWTENKFQENKMNSKLMVADLDGQNKKTLIEKYFDGQSYLNPIRWSNSNEEIYFAEQAGGLGGYIIFSGPTNLSKVNIYSGKLESLFGKSNYIGYISDISPNEKFIACFTGGNNPKLTIKNMETGKENKVDIPIEKGFRGGGNAHFSPDSKYLVYNIAHWDPDDEYYQTIVIDSVGEKQKVIIDDSQKIYRAIRWISNSEILLLGPDSTNYIININGNNLRKK